MLYPLFVLYNGTFCIHYLNWTMEHFVSIWICRMERFVSIIWFEQWNILYPLFELYNGTFCIHYLYYTMEHFVSIIWIVQWNILIEYGTWHLTTKTGLIYSYPKMLTTFKIQIPTDSTFIQLDCKLAHFISMLVKQHAGMIGGDAACSMCRLTPLPVAYICETHSRRKDCLISTLVLLFYF